MKILMTNSFYPPYHVGGACTQSKYLAESLVKRGYDKIKTNLSSQKLAEKTRKEYERVMG